MLAILCMAFSLVEGAIIPWGFGFMCAFDFGGVYPRHEEQYFLVLFFTLSLLSIASGLAALGMGILALYKMLRSKKKINAWSKVICSLILPPFSVLIIPLFSLAFIAPGNSQYDVERGRFGLKGIFKAEMKQKQRTGSFAKNCSEMQKFIEVEDIIFYLSPSEACYAPHGRKIDQKIYPLPPGLKPFVGEREFLIVAVFNTEFTNQREVMTINEKGKVRRMTKRESFRKIISNRIHDGYDFFRFSLPFVIPIRRTGTDATIP